MNCPKCQSELIEETVEGRERQKCPKCSYMHYDYRGTTGAYHSVVDDIADTVAANGHCDRISIALINTCFPGASSFWDQVKGWSLMHGFTYSSFEGKDAQGEKRQFVRFSRK